MQVEIISITTFMGLEKIGSEALIAHIARVSNPSNQHNHATSTELIKYMIEHKHWSPFEMVDFTVKITTSRAIAQQIIRHRSFSFQEFSQRYAEVQEIEPLELRYQAESNRQSSSEELSAEDANYFDVLVDDINNKAQHLYLEMLSAGVAKECARMILPLNTQTTIYMKGSVRSWIHYLQIRCAEETQKEHRDIANKVLNIFKAFFPNISKALEL